jgi:hypothetical protein
MRSLCPEDFGLKTIPFDFKSGSVVHNTWAVDENLPLGKQLWEHGEDLFQVKFKKNALVLDVSWVQNGKDDRGQFVLYLVKERNWEVPLIKSVATSLRGLKRAVTRAVNLAETFEQRS